MASIQDVFTEFLISNFALHPRDCEKDIVLGGEDSRTLTIDFVRPHECTRRLDLLLRLKREVVEKEPPDDPESVFFFLKVVRILNMIMQTSCPTLEDKIAKYNLRIANSYCNAYFDEMQVEKSEVLSIIRYRRSVDDPGDTERANDSTQLLGRIQVLEWLLMNFSIWAEATAYFNAVKFLEMACKFSGIEMSFHGQMGRRTKFQQMSLPQLVMKPTPLKVVEWNFESRPITLPDNVANLDDTVLNRLSLDKDKDVNADDLDTADVGVLDTAQISCILATAWLKLRNDAFIELRFEVIDAMINAILDQKSIGFMIASSALILRSEAERMNTHRVERACQQMESLVDALENRSNSYVSAEEASLRIQDLFLTSPMQPVWITKKLYAKVLMSMALTSEAIGVFESICDWESVIECYSILNMKEKALKILESLQKDHPDNPFYLCMIGEIRRDETLLNKVISITNDKYPKAHKVLGMMYLEAKNYQKAFKHLKRVFELSPLSIQAVYNYGVSALEVGEIKDAITAFHHCVSIDPENYRSWNNLAASYVRSNQNARAVQVMKQGLKIHNESDRMWSNLFELAAELPSKKECLVAFKRYLQFKPKNINMQPLLTIVLTHTNATEGTLYPAPPLPQDPLTLEEMKLLIECLEGAHQICTLEPMTLRLLAHLQKPGQNETDPKVFEHFIELMDLAENRELKGAGTPPDYGNVLKGLLSIYEVRCRYAELTGRDTKALNKIIGYRIRPLLKKIDADIGQRLNTDERYAPLKEVIEEANSLLDKI